MKRMIHSAINISHKDYVEQFNNHYSKRDFHYRQVDNEGNVRFTEPTVAARLLKSFNKQYLDAKLELDSDYYEDENGYNVSYWFVR